MKKIPTLFKRIFDEDGHIETITDEITPGCEEAFKKGVATVKWDGACCAIINGELYKRYDAKKGKKPPAGAIPCQEAPDPITTHWPHWVKVDPEKPENKWFVQAWQDSTFQGAIPLPDGTYEAMGKHFQGNPYGASIDWLTRHGIDEISVPRTYEGVKRFLQENAIEGIVFWLDGAPVCKIKRTDFGLPWPIRSDIHQ